jgi:AcrR family transcriptional regulator
MPRVPLSPTELESVRRQAIDAAKKLYSARGARALSVRGIAAELGLSTGGLYRYFSKGHDEILAAVRCDAYQTLINILQTAASKAQDPYQRLDDLADAFFDFATNHSTDFELLFVYQEGDWDFCSELTELETQCWDPLESVLRDGVESGDFEGDPKVLARSFYAAIVGSLSIWLSGDDDPLLSIHRLRESLFGLLIRGATPLTKLTELSQTNQLQAQSGT